jgi:hypothetical protein
MKMEEEEIIDLGKMDTEELHQYIKDLIEEELKRMKESGEFNKDIDRELDDLIDNMEPKLVEIELDHNTKILLDGMGVDLPLLISKEVHDRRDTERILNCDSKTLKSFKDKGWLTPYKLKNRHFYPTEEILTCLKIQEPRLMIPLPEINENS